MNEEIYPPANRLSELPEETREFLSGLSHEDISTIKSGLPVIRMIIGFGKVTKWIAITALGLLIGLVMAWDALVRIASWFKPSAGH